jgi:hypothetical protein
VRYTRCAIALGILAWPPPQLAAQQCALEVLVFAGLTSYLPPLAGYRRLYSFGVQYVLIDDIVGCALLKRIYKISDVGGRGSLC